MTEEQRKKEEVEQRKRINWILEQLSHYYFHLNGDMYPVHEFYFCIHEISLIKGWDSKILESCFGNKKLPDDPKTYDELEERYNEVKKRINSTTKEQLVSFYVPTNIPLSEEIQLDSFSIRQIDTSSQSEFIKRSILKSEVSQTELGWLSNNLISFVEFSTKGISIESVKTKFFSTFHLFKGICEYSYGHNDLEPLYNRLKRQSSHFKYPSFVYSKCGSEEEVIKDLQLKDVYDSFSIRNPNNKSPTTNYNERNFEEVLSFFIKNQNTKSKLYNLLSSCMRLYCLGVDSPYRDQSFLYFWNVLEEITVRYKQGNTREVINRVLFLIGAKTILFGRSVDEIMNVRNTLVHHGISGVTFLNLSLLKLICDQCLVRVFHNLELFKTQKDLEIFYHLDDLKLRDSQRLVREDFETIQRFSKFFPKEKP